MAGGILIFVFIVGFLFAFVPALWAYSDANQNSSDPAFLWATVVFLAPILGVVLYLLLGYDGGGESGEASPSDIPSQFKK